jgi:hypothetical protein
MGILEEEANEQEQSSGKSWLLWGGILLAVLAVGTVGYLYLQGGEEPPTEVATAPVPPPEPEPEPEPPPPPPPPTPTTGSLTVNANVEGANVFFDGNAVGEAPYQQGDLKPGSYQIRVEKEGFETFEEVVRITAGQGSQVRATLEAVMASLRIESDVAGATVFLDREYLGTTPIETKGLQPGTYELTASADGYDMYAETVELAREPRDILISFKTVKLDESISVVHKHRFGDCKGVLRATLQGLRYETDHKDAFLTPFAGLERFEVDYIEKNLNLKIKGGRNYNFTAQSGNPDDLYVFHQRVQEAIQKLRDLGAEKE